MPTTETSNTETAVETTTPISAVLIDDHRVFLDAFGNLLTHDGRIEVVASATTTAAGVDAVEQRRPGLVILDVEVDGTPVEHTLRKIQRVSPQSAVVVVTMHNHAPLRDMLLRAGARAFLSKSTSGAVLIDALVEAVATPPAHHSKRPVSAQHEQLTEREGEVLRLISLAQSNKQIATRLGITESTVKRHANSIFVKLGATSRLEAVRKAADRGLLS